MSKYNSPEYRAIKKCSPDLANAVQDDLAPLSGELSAAGLITKNNAANLQNEFIGAAERAAKLVGYLLNGVSLNTGEYHSFVGVLENRKDDYKRYENTLEILDKNFRELGGRYPLPKPSKSYKDDDETLPSAPKRAKTETSNDETLPPPSKKAKAETSLSATSPSTVADSCEIIDGTNTAPNEGSDLENDPFHCRCSFIGQQDISPPPSDVDSSGDHYAAFKRGVNLWNEPTVTVAFTPTSFNYIETRNATWKLDSIEKILELANTWHKLQKDPKHIPKFIPFPGQNIQRADIIVELNEKGVSKSKCGNDREAGSTEPSMWLDLSGPNDNYNKHLVVHEFGHALGLGHEHQRSDFRACVIPFLDETKMHKSLGKRYKDWERNDELDIDSATEYDSESVMHYWFEKKWLKHGYDDRKQILKHFEKQILSEKMKNALLAVHTCKYETLPTKPSAKDLAFVNGPVMYGKIKPEN